MQADTAQLLSRASLGDGAVADRLLTRFFVSDPKKCRYHPRRDADVGVSFAVMTSRLVGLGPARRTKVRTEDSLGVRIGKVHALEPVAGVRRSETAP